MALNFRRSQNSSDQPLGSRYKITDKLGEGGFGQTFKAQDLHLPGNPLCVVKQLKPQVEDAQGLQVARRLFDTEAKVLYQLGSYPQIPNLLAHFEENNEFYLAQELIMGHSLADEFETVPWDVPKVIAFLGDVLETLAFVHKNRVIHRDLKPSNLIRRQSDNRIVLIDFGAVKQAGTQPAGPGGISHTISIGTQGYMPNEQLAGQPQFSSDIYAVGIMGIQALTGRLPKELAPNAQTGELDWHQYVPHIPQELIGILDIMVRYDFRARYASAKEALNALRLLPNELGQYISAAGAAAPANRSVQPVKPPLTEMTVPAMASPPAGMANNPKSSVATEVVPMRSHRRSIPKLPAVVIGGAILGIGLLIGRACTSANPTDTEAPVATQAPPPTSAPAPAVTKSAAPIELPDIAAPTEPSKEATAPPEPDPIEPPEEIAEPTEPPEITEPSEPPEEEEETEPVLTPTLAQTVLTDFYNHLSNQSWEQAKAQTSGNVAQQFNPSFFQQFQRVSVENLQIKAQTPETIEFLGQNTYVFNDGSLQQEERTFIVELVDGQPRIVDSAFVRVLKSR